MCGQQFSTFRQQFDTCRLQSRTLWKQSKYFHSNPLLAESNSVLEDLNSVHYESNQKYLQSSTCGQHSVLTHMLVSIKPVYNGLNVILLNTNIHIYIHTYVHTYIHTYILYIQMHTIKFSHTVLSLALLLKKNKKKNFESVARPLKNSREKCQNN